MLMHAGACLEFLKSFAYYVCSPIQDKFNKYLMKQPTEL